MRPKIEIVCNQRELELLGCTYYCSVVSGSPQCSCPDGFLTLEHLCADVNECAGSNSCTENEVCVNMPGTYRCEPKVNYNVYDIVNDKPRSSTFYYGKTETCNLPSDTRCGVNKMYDDIKAGVLFVDFRNLRIDKIIWLEIDSRHRQLKRARQRTKCE